MTLYQLQSAQVDFVHKLYRDGEINQDELICKLRDAEIHLKEAVRYLLYEPVKSPEGKIAQMAMSELKMLRMSIQSISKEFLINDIDIGRKEEGITTEKACKNSRRQTSKSYSNKRHNRKK